MIELLETSCRIAIVTHADPDLDGISSSLALAHILEERGKQILLLCSDAIPSQYDFLNGVGKFRQSMSRPDGACGQKTQRMEHVPWTPL